MGDERSSKMVIANAITGLTLTAVKVNRHVNRSHNYGRARQLGSLIQHSIARLIATIYLVVNCSQRAYFFVDNNH